MVRLVQLSTVVALAGCLSSESRDFARQCDAHAEPGMLTACVETAFFTLSTEIESCSDDTTEVRECEARAEATYAACIDRGGSEDACAREVDAVMDACEEPREEGSCDDSVAEAYEDCLDEGGTAEECRLFAAEASEGCERDEAPRDTGCEGEAEEAYLACTEAGGSEEDCSERVESMGEACGEEREERRMHASLQELWDETSRAIETGETAPARRRAAREGLEAGWQVTTCER